MANKAENINSTIGAGSSFEGKFYIHGSLRIDGKFEGEIKTENELVVGETGKVKTDIFARSVVVAGTVIGNINAIEEVRLLETAKVLGDINTPILTIQNGVVAKGSINLTGNHGKDAIRVIEDSYNSIQGKQQSKQ